MEVNALTAVGAFMTLIDFTLSNARRFYSSKGNPLAVKGLTLVSTNNREFKIYDAIEATTPHILHSNEQKQNLCTPLTCFYYFCTFLSRSRQICDVK